MEDLIKQAFLHIEVIGPHVAEGHYDLVGPNGDIILPQVWETVVEPDWTITMHMWPIPDKPKEPDPPAAEAPPAPAKPEAAPEPKKKPETGTFSDFLSGLIGPQGLLSVELTLMILQVLRNLRVKGVLPCLSGVLPVG